MRPSRIIIYLVVFIAFGLFYYFYEVRLGEKEKKLKEARTKIFEIEMDRVTAFKLRTPEAEFHAVRPGRGKWRLLEPIPTPADGWAVEGLIRQAVKGEKDRVFSGPINNLAEFGLDEPRLSLTLLGGGKVLAPTLYIEHKNPMGQLSYARLGRLPEVFTVAAALPHSLNKTLFDLRDKSLILAKAEKIDQVLIFGQEEVELKKKGPRRWMVVKPEAGPADRDAVQKLIHRTLKGRVKKFLRPAGPKDEYGFKDSRLKVRALINGRLAAEITLGRAEGGPEKGDVEGYWAYSTEREKEVMLISGEMALGLNLTYGQVKNRRVFPDLDLNPLTGFEIVRGRARLEAEKKDDVWEIIEPKKPLSKDYDLESFIAGLEELRFERTEEPSPDNLKKFGLDNPDLTVRLSFMDGKNAGLDVSLIPIEEDLWAVRAQTGPIALIKKADLSGRLPIEVRPPGRAEKKKNNTIGGH